MEDATDKSLLAALVNKVNKKLDPVGYATNAQAKEVYAKALLYKPTANASKSKSTTLDLDDVSKKVIKKVIPRMIACHEILYRIVASKNSENPDLNPMLKLRREMPEAFSACDNAIVLGLVEWKRVILKQQLNEYESDADQTGMEKSLTLAPDSKESKRRLEVSVADLKAAALKKYTYLTINPFTIFSAQGPLAGLLHYISKHYVFCINHLTDAASRELCTGLEYFNPSHPNHTVDPELTLDPGKEWHRELVRKVIDRENIFLTNLYYYLVHDNPEEVMRLSRPKNNASVSAIPTGIFAGVTDNLSSAYLSFKRKEKQEQRLATQKLQQEELDKKKRAEDTAARQAKLQALEESDNGSSDSPGSSSPARAAVPAPGHTASHSIYVSKDVGDTECQCGSKKLFKDCCGKSTPRALPQPPTSKPAAK